MKKSTFIIRSLFLAIGLFWISTNSYSQDVKLTRQERKEAHRAEMEANFHALDTLLHDKSFVLEADFLENRYGVKIPVTSILNFIRVNRSNAVLQTGTSSGFGTNGVGGVTAEGNIGKYKVGRDVKNLSHTLQFSVITNIGPYDVFMTINANNDVRATITGLTPGKLIYDGHLATIDNSRVFKGQNTI